MTDFYESEYWQAERRKAFSEQGEVCAQCGTTDGPLHVHHVFGTTNEEYEILCSQCHAGRHGKDELDSGLFSYCAHCGLRLRWALSSGGKRYPQDPRTKKAHTCKVPFRFTPLGREPDLVRLPGEEPLQCANCGVELVCPKNPLCLECYESWRNGDVWPR